MMVVGQGALRKTSSARTFNAHMHDAGTLQAFTQSSHTLTHAQRADRQAPSAIGQPHRPKDPDMSSKLRTTHNSNRKNKHHKTYNENANHTSKRTLILEKNRIAESNFFKD